MGRTSLQAMSLAGIVYHSLCMPVALGRKPVLGNSKNHIDETTNVQTAPPHASRPRYRD